MSLTPPLTGYLQFSLYVKIDSSCMEPLLRGRLSTIDLLVLTSLDQHFLILQEFLLFYKTTYLNVDVHHTEPSASVSVPR
jgi:hypothetical protein